MYKLDNIDDVDSTVDSTDMLTKEMLISTLPDKRFRRHVTDEILELINSETFPIGFPPPLGDKIFQNSE